MRTALAAAAALVCTAPALAQTAPYLAEVTAESVAIRCGPSDQMPETGMLFRGARVIVDHDEGDQWVAIQPPRGQVSWVKHLHLGPMEGQQNTAIPRNAVIHAEPEAELAFGRSGLGKPLDVRRTRIPDQTIVLVIGNKVEHGGSIWYPIEPPDGDYRYVPKSALRFVRGQTSAGFVVRTPSPQQVPPEPKPAFEPVAASVPNRPAATVGAAKPADWPSHPLWQQAEQAERTSDYSRAETLYLKLAAEMNQPGGDPDLANLCYARVHAVREKQRAATSRPRTIPPDSGRRDLPPSAQWVGPGVLRQAGFRIENRSTFALVGPRGEVKCYAVAAPGVDLDRFRGYEVELHGMVSSSSDTRGVGVMTVTRVQLTRDR